MGISNIIVLVIGLALVSVHSAEAQQPKKVSRIGYLSPSDPATESTRSEPIRRALHERGYIEGQNITIEYRYAEGKVDRFSELAAELVRLKVDVIVVGGSSTKETYHPGGVDRWECAAIELNCPTNQFQNQTM